MFRKAPFWIVFSLISVLFGIFAATNFSKAFPIVALDLEMDREGALEKARQLAENYGWGPDDYRQAASFGVEGNLQSFVELEGGGKEAFGEMIRGDLYSPYTWTVRHFQPGETTETRIDFTPAGKPWGFEETLPEDEPGPSLGEEAARRQAEDAARSWGIELDAFELVESSEELRRGGRTDHAFVYERTGLAIGDEGRYRLRLTVSGERFTGLVHFVDVPEGFTRRFEEMRSANNAIAMVAGVVLFVLFLGAGCGVGLFFLFRRRWVIWKTPALWGVFVAFLQLLTGLNQWPLVWMGYDTAVSTANFTMLYLGGQLAAFAGYAIFFTLIFMAAESLSRRAFPHHLQLWKTWTSPAASSPQVLGGTVAGYFMISVFFAYEVVLYFVTRRALGWWSPADSLYDPDALATWFPWLPSIALSLQAGFWEECLFRAVPLSCAALIGRKLGHRRWWIAAAMIGQAVVFAAGHANYPNQPAYARVVELVPPALGFGFVFLRFGLLPVVVLHFAYDVVWFSLPILASSAPGATLQQAIVAVLTLVPLLVVLARRVQAGAWRSADERSYNRAWQPPERGEPQAPEALPERTELPPRLRLGLAAAGLVGLVLWGVSDPFSSYAPRLEISRGEAVEAARGGLQDFGFELPEAWKTMSSVEASTGLAHRYVWQEGDPETFREVLGRYLPDPRWRVRFASFEGEVTERAEEVHVWVSGHGDVSRSFHRLPEARAGADLAEDDARALAHAALKRRYGVDAGTLEEISASPQKRPERRDWTFTYKDPGHPIPGAGEGRYGVEIAGDEVTHVFRFVHLPEAWEREERNRSSLLLAAQATSVGLAVLAFVVAVGVAVLRWTRKKLAVGMFLRFSGLVFVLGLVSFFNSWPESVASFSTAQPYLLQVGLLIVTGPIAFGVLALGLGLTVGLIHGAGAGIASPQSPRGDATSAARVLVPGLGLGAVAAGLAAFGGRWGSATDPAWADFGAAGKAFPFVETALGPLIGLVMASAFLLLILQALDGWTRRWTRRRGIAAALCPVVGLVLAGIGGVTSIPLWLVSGLLHGVLLLAAYVVVLRHDLTIVPVAVAVATILGLVREAVLGVYPSALVGNVTAIVLVMLLSAYWFKALRA